MMLEQVCGEIRNYFVRDERDVHFGRFTVEGGILSPCDFLCDGQYYRIAGSVNADGIYRWPEAPQVDGEIECTIWAMRVPADFIDLCNEIAAYVESDGKPSGFTSESFGGYSYTKATTESGQPVSWRDVFKSRLNPYRKARAL